MPAPVSRTSGPPAPRQRRPPHGGRRPARPGRRLVLAALFAVCACTAARTADAPQPAPTPSHLHAVESARLREIMHELERLRVDRLPPEMDTAALVGRRLDELGEIGDALAAAAVRMPEAIDRRALEPSDRVQFEALVETLRRQSLALRSRAAEGNLDAAVDAYERTAATCDACHALFRGVP